MIDKATLQLIFQSIRESFKRCSLYKDALSNSLSSLTGPRGGKLYTCTLCSEAFKPTELEIDHLEPVVELDRRWHSYSTEEYYSRVFCNLSNLRVLCKKCHKANTKSQKLMRK